MEFLEWHMVLIAYSVSTTTAHNVVLINLTLVWCCLLDITVLMCCPSSMAGAELWLVFCFPQYFILLNIIKAFLAHVTFIMFAHGFYVRIKNQQNHSLL